jgi:hypothetical protein
MGKLYFFGILMFAVSMAAVYCVVPAARRRKKR